MRTSLLTVFPVVLFTAACGPDFAEINESPANVHSSAQAVKASSTAVYPLIDHGGPVTPASATYAIYWGVQTDFDSDLQGAMASLLGGMNGSSYLSIATQYMRGASVSTQYMGATIDASAPPSKAPTTAALGAEVCKLFASPDPNGVYVVFTSNAPHVNYCAWHDKATCNGATFSVAYVPNQALLPGCSPYTKVNLGCNAYSNGTVAAADSVAHEFFESITDPQISAWYDKSKAEIADKCEYNYAACVSLANGSSWEIQQEWSNAIGGCQQQ
jgi:hypothetical protein